jgi:hypothetical protein
MHALDRRSQVNSTPRPFEDQSARQSGAAYARWSRFPWRITMLSASLVVIVASMLTTSLFRNLLPPEDVHASTDFLETRFEKCESALAELRGASSYLRKSIPMMRNPKVIAPVISKYKPVFVQPSTAVVAHIPMTPPFVGPPLPPAPEPFSSVLQCL